MHFLNINNYANQIQYMFRSAHRHTHITCYGEYHKSLMCECFDLSVCVCARINVCACACVCGSGNGWQLPPLQLNMLMCARVCLFVLPCCALFCLPIAMNNVVVHAIVHGTLHDLFWSTIGILHWLTEPQPQEQYTIRRHKFIYAI